MSSYFDHDTSFANNSTIDNGFEDSDSGFLPEASALDTPSESFNQFDAATTPTAQTEVAQKAEPTFGGYYNADGTYHYTSDNTDRDPETGAIVRRW